MHREVCFRGYKALGSWTAMVRAWFLRALLCEKKGQSQSTNLLTHITTHHAEPGTVYVIIYIIYMVRCFLPERGAYFIYQPFAGKVQPTSTNLYTILLDIWCLLTVKLFFFFPEPSTWLFLLFASGHQSKTTTLYSIRRTTRQPTLYGEFPVNRPINRPINVPIIDIPISRPIRRPIPKSINIPSILIELLIYLLIYWYLLLDEFLRD